MSPRDTAPRLGRGLAALMGEAPVAARETGDTIRSVPLTDLEPGPFQARGAFDPESLAELAASIRTHGVLQPLIVRSHPARPGHHQILAGERRWRAAQEAGLHEVPVLVRDIADREAMAIGLVENLQRTDLNPAEEAEGYRRLIDEFGLTQEQLGDAIGKSRSHVANTLRLLNLPSTVIALLRQGRLTAGHARALLAHPDPVKAAHQVMAGGLNVRQTEALAAPRPPREAPAEDPDTAALARDLTDRLGLKVDIRFDGKGGSVRIAYATLDQLDGIVALLNRG